MKVRKQITKRVLTLAVAVIFSNPSIAQKFSTQSGTAFFKATIPMSSYVGTSSKLKGTIDFNTNSIEFILPVKSIHTGNKKRDSHLLIHLKSESFPNVTFKGLLLDEYDFNKPEKQTIKVSGNFTLAGFTNEIEVLVDLISAGKGIKCVATWSLLITDYGLERPSKAFFKVDDKHEMRMEAFLILEK